MIQPTIVNNTELVWILVTDTQKLVMGDPFFYHAVLTICSVLIAFGGLFVGVGGRLGSSA